jgi:hypothetical protein
MNPDIADIIPGKYISGNVNSCPANGELRSNINIGHKGEALVVSGFNSTNISIDPGAVTEQVGHIGNAIIASSDTSLSSIIRISGPGPVHLVFHQSNIGVALAPWNKA